MVVVVAVVWWLVSMVSAAAWMRAAIFEALVLYPRILFLWRSEFGDS